MATTNHERIGKAMELLRVGLAPYVDREMSQPGANFEQRKHRLKRIADMARLSEKPLTEWDVAGLLRVMGECWSEAFGSTLGYAEQALVTELRGIRNDWAHQKPFTGDNTDRALDSMGRLLTAIAAPEADEVMKMRLDLRRLVYDEQVRGERRKVAAPLFEATVSGNLKPWREVVTPHTDVATGRYHQAEFAADLWQVHIGKGTDEYRNPVEFFRRTYLTESLGRLLIDGIRRLNGSGGDPVVQLQTNFGGGKTHSMLALYHLVGGTPAGELPGVDELLADAGVKELPSAKRVVLVGNKISPGSPTTKPDGTIVRTIWGELAWQLGGAEAFARIAADDAKATSPGDTLRELFDAYGPCLILIDEWVAYARQLHDDPDLPGGTFETQFTFAQALSEAAKAASRCLLVVSLPASDAAGTASPQSDDAEVGGARGREALERLSNVIGRLESSWRPASAEESFEIVRRRLFEPLTGPDAFKQRDVTARAFAELYHTQAAEFPPECNGPDYEKRIQAAYPIHPEIFDRLYSDWSSLLKFQRTRGVLRLMAAVIHSLWEKGDRNPLILPSSIPIDDPRVEIELTRYLSDNWVPVIAKDVDGPNSTPLRLDAEVPNLGKFAATRRVARTIYLGSAPTADAAQRGLEDRRVRLGCVMPGETPAVFGDALRRLSAAATFLYQDGPRYWYSTQPTVTKLAEDRAEQLRRDPDRVAHELDLRIRTDLRRTGDFRRVHPLPRSSQDIPDDLDARLVVLGAEHPYSKEPDSPAEVAAKDILAHRGNSPRLFQNSLVFVAADRTRLAELDEAIRHFLAWTSILSEMDTLDLSPHQVKQAEIQRDAANGAVNARLPETYHWLIVPSQAVPQKGAPAPAIVWQAVKLTGQESLADRASRRLRSDEHLVTALGPSRLRMELDRVPLWRGDHVSIKQLVDDFGRYLYLPRLASHEVLLAAVRDGIATLTWAQDTFAYAESFDDAGERYRGLRVGVQVTVPDGDAPGLLVKADVAGRQIEAERQVTVVGPGGTTAPTLPTGSGVGGGAQPGPVPPPPPAAPAKPRRFHGTVRLNSLRVGADAGRIADEVIAHLVALDGADVMVTLEIEAAIPQGAPDNVVRTVTENSRTLKFEQLGFEDF